MFANGPIISQSAIWLNLSCRQVKPSDTSASSGDRRQVASARRVPNSENSMSFKLVVAALALTATLAAPVTFAAAAKTKPPAVALKAHAAKAPVKATTTKKVAPKTVTKAKTPAKSVTKTVTKTITKAKT